MIKEIDRFLSSVLGEFSPKQQRVIEDRFGLKSGRHQTLQEIGDSLGVTRERVRQIEAQVLKKITPRLRKEMGGFLREVEEYLKSVGGVRRDDHFIADVKMRWFKNVQIKHLDHKIRFLLWAAGHPRFHKADDSFDDFWYTDETAKRSFMEFTKKATAFFKRAGKEKVLENPKAHLALCKDVATCHFYAIPRHFASNVFGDVGLREWAEIYPKTVRDKAYLVLKKHGKPSHFSEIARLIHTSGLQKKPAHVQTVHNELIKDKRFVLVGRGMYGLQEHGFAPGTVRDVIATLLKQHGPLDADNVIQLVGKQRFLKENTVLLNLQNKKHFERLNDGTYRVREA